MSCTTTTAFIINGTWSDEVRSHPAMKWMEDYTKNYVDQRNWDDYKSWHTKDYSYQKSDGQVVTGIDDAVVAVKATYGAFTAHMHRPYHGVVTEAEDGWDMIGQAHLYANLVGESKGGDKVTDPEGNSWDLMVPSAFRFHYVKDSSAPHDGILLKKMEINGDTAPIIMELMKRGIIGG